MMGTSSIKDHTESFQDVSDYSTTIYILLTSPNFTTGKQNGLQNCPKMDEK
jgi:hypothetical protein